MGYITIRKTAIDRLTIDNSFSVVSVINNATREVRSISIEDLLEYVRQSGTKSKLPRRGEKTPVGKAGQA